MEINHLHFMWIIYSFIVTFCGVNVLFVKNIPSVLVRFYSFGKAHKSFNKQNSVIKWFEIPKRWFSHFYVFAVVYFLFITKAVLLRYFGNVSSPFFVQLLNLLGSSKREGIVSAESVVILSILLFLQVCRRCYECLFVSVYSDAKMNISHYIVGFTFYFGVGLSLLHDAPGFEKFNDHSVNYISGKWVTLPHLIGVVLFLSAFNLQFKTHKTLASLRKTGDKVTSTGHYLPTSGFFEYVSCPHYFAEIVIYLSGCIILGGKSYSWWLVCLWTVCSQILTGLMSHQWYKKTFKNYPVKRKAVIPFLL
ncbi:polyprenol reductase-like [Argiope bruennichi]|uniref:Polyprenal reductase n=1 Tax=Argiope bruennichi TaxID=94029 RepID=A0A8T0FQB3_ARGBR|nr:polyprenol reductase-like [Argiope bruennichi]KAF8793301.1 Polyprenol reductase like protein [Argiope bruennichi]